MMCSIPTQQPKVRKKLRKLAKETVSEQDKIEETFRKGVGG